MLLRRCYILRIYSVIVSFVVRLNIYTMTTIPAIIVQFAYKVQQPGDGWDAI